MRVKLKYNINCIFSQSSFARLPCYWFQTISILEDRKKFEVTKSNKCFKTVQTFQILESVSYIVISNRCYLQSDWAAEIHCMIIIQWIHKILTTVSWKGDCKIQLNLLIPTSSKLITFNSNFPLAPLIFFRLRYIWHSLAFFKGSLTDWKHININ